MKIEIKQSYIKWVKYMICVEDKIVNPKQKQIEDYINEVLNNHKQSWLDNKI